MNDAVRALLAGCLLGHALTATAADFITLEDECRGRQIMITGVIEPGDHQALVRHLTDLASGELPPLQDPEKLWTVMLDSPGGDTAEAMRMGRFLRRAMATTETSYRFAPRPDGVYDFARSSDEVCLDGEGRLSGCYQDIVEAECSGACLLVWMGGADRYANEGRLGVHGLAGDDAGAVRDYLVEMGLAPSQAAAVLDEPGDGWLTWPRRHDLSGRAQALQQLVAGCPAPLSDEDSYLSVTASNEAQRERLLDQAERHRACRRARLATVRDDLLGQSQMASAPSGSAPPAEGR